MSPAEVIRTLEHQLSIVPEDGEPPAGSRAERVRRAQWLRAAILGANDGLLSTSTIMLGVSSAKHDRWSTIVAGVAGAVAGAFSMALGEFVSVSVQRDIEAEVNASQTHAKAAGVRARQPVEAPSPGRSPMMRAMAASVDHDKESLPNPVTAAVASGMAFLMGSAMPLLSGAFVGRYKIRVLVLVAVTTVALAGFGGAGALLGGSSRVRMSAARVLIGGWLAMGITYWLLKLLDVDDTKV